MEYTLIQNPTLDVSACMVVGLFSDAALPNVLQSLDKAHGGLLTKLAKKASLPGDLVWQAELEGRSLVLIQCGEEKAWTPTSLRKRLGEMVEFLIKQRLLSATVCMPPLKDVEVSRLLEQMILQVDNKQYQFLLYKKKNVNANALKSLAFYLPGASEETLVVAKAICAGIHLTRDLANMPANICTPSYLGEQAKELASKYSSVSCQVMGPKEIKDLGMGLLQAVSSGSAQEARFIEIQYKGAGSAQPVVLVGKGVTFDAGGLSIKIGNFMEEMKYDMCGAASVLGVIKICALLKLAVNVVGLIPSTENLLGDSAMKCGDVVTSLSGQTVEIINTDAEGRLILADALTYAERFNPAFVIDIATLTGAVIVSLGSVASGFMTQDEDLAKLIFNASQESEDRVWRLPLDEDYQDALESPVADMLNAGFDRTAGSITAACFLSRFTEKYRWAHLDIAGTAWIMGKKRNATGRPVTLLIQLLRHVANSR